LNYLIFKEVLIRIGFITESILQSCDKSSGSISGEVNILYDVWRNLGGESTNHITLNNLRIFLLAIMGVYVEPILNREE
jgi:hypothetical protein